MLAPIIGGALGCVYAVVILAKLLQRSARRRLSMRPLRDGALRRYLLGVAQQQKVALADIRLVSITMRKNFAGLMSIGRKKRAVVFTDFMLAQLPPEQASAVFLHELAHAAHYDLRTKSRFHITVGFFAAAVMAEAYVLFPQDPWAPWAAFVLTFGVLWLTVLPLTNHLMEHWADWFAVQALPGTAPFSAEAAPAAAHVDACQPVPPAGDAATATATVAAPIPEIQTPFNGAGCRSQSEAATVYSRMLLNLVHSPAVMESGKTFTHPAIASRIGAVRRLARDPSAAAAMDRRGRRVARLATVLSYISFALFLLALWRSS